MKSRWKMKPPCLQGASVSGRVFEWHLEPAVELRQDARGTCEDT